MKPWLETELARAAVLLLKRSATPSPAGKPSAAFSMMAASASTTIPSSARSDPSRSAARTFWFAGSDGEARWATVCSLVATAKLNDVEPFAYLKDVLEPMTNGTSQAASTISCRGTGPR